MTLHDIEIAAERLADEVDECARVASVVLDTEVTQQERDHARAEIENPRWLTETFHRFIALRRAHLAYCRQQGIEAGAPAARRRDADGEGTMTATEARRVIAVTSAWVRQAPAFTDAAANERSAVLATLGALDAALANPASLCTRDEIFAALDQIGTGALVAYISDRLSKETERSRAVREDLDPPTIPDPSEAP